MKNPNGPSIEEIDDWNDALSDERATQLPQNYHAVFPSKHARIPTALFLNPIDAKNYAKARCRESARIESWTLPALRNALDSRIRDSIIAQFGEPLDTPGDCDGCLAKNLELWASLDVDGNWIGLCASCVRENCKP